LIVLNNKPLTDVCKSENCVSISAANAAVTTAADIYAFGICALEVGWFIFCFGYTSYFILKRLKCDAVMDA
jgi:hypothetical protein